MNLYLSWVVQSHHLYQISMEWVSGVQIQRYYHKRQVNTQKYIWMYAFWIVYFRFMSISSFITHYTFFFGQFSISFICLCWETRISLFPYLGLYRCMQNCPRLLNPMQWKEKTIFLPIQDLEIIHQKTLPLIQMFPNQFWLMKMKNEGSGSLIQLRYFA